MMRIILPMPTLMTMDASFWQLDNTSAIYFPFLFLPEHAIPIFYISRT